MKIIFGIVIVSLIGIFFILKSLKMNTETINMKTKYFLDLDYFSLKGINEISVQNLKFPYIKIDSVNVNTKEISVCFDEKTIFKRTYIKNDSIWYSEHTVIDQEEGKTFYFYEYISENNILKLEYDGNPFKEGSLTWLSILKNGKISFYNFEPGEIHINPSSNITDYTLETSISKGISEFKIENEIFIYKTKYLDVKTDDLLKDEVMCYKINDLSYFWWTFIGNRLKKVKC